MLEEEAVDVIDSGSIRRHKTVPGFISNLINKSVVSLHIYVCVCVCECVWCE